MFDPKAHAKQLLALYERYSVERPDSAADQQGLRCARELVRLMSVDRPDEAEVAALCSELTEWPEGAGSAWADLQLVAQNWRRR